MAKKLTKAEADAGVRFAYEGAISVLQDPKSPPTSRASASGTLIKIVELLQKDDREGKEPSEMSFDEIGEAIAKLEAQRTGVGPEDGVFD